MTSNHSAYLIIALSRFVRVSGSMVLVLNTVF